MDAITELDELVIRVRLATQRPEWRRQLTRGTVHELTIGDLRVLRSVERRARQGADVSIGGVAEDIGVEHSTASRAVTAVVAKRLLTKSVSSADQRCTSLALTDAGREALEETTQRRREMVAEVVTDWSSDDLASLLKFLRRLANDLEADLP